MYGTLRCRLADLAESIGGYGANRVDGGGDACLITVVEEADPSLPAINVTVAEAGLYRIQRKMAGCGQPAGQIAGIEQGEPDAGLRSGLDQRLTHGIGIGVPAAVQIVVQIVELPHDGVSGLRHLGEHGAGEGEVGIRIEACGEGVHLLTPGPEGAACGVCSARSPRWKAWLWPLARPGSVTPRRIC